MKTNSLQKNIPKGWEVRKVEDILTLEYGKPLKESDRISGSIPVFGSNGIVGFNNASLVKGPGVIVGRKGGAGEVMFSGKDFYPIDTAYFVKTDLDKKFTYYLLVGLDLKKHSGGSAVPGLNRKDAHNKKVLIPKKEEEQKKIAEVLSSVDENIQKVEEVISATEKLKSGLMQNLFTKGVQHKKFKKTKIGSIPDLWDLVKLQEVANLSTGTTPATGNKSYYQGDIPFIKTGEIINKLIDKSSVYISQEAVDRYGLKKYQPGTIFLAMYGQGKTRGQTGLLTIEACTSQNAAAIVPTDKIQSEFLWLFLQYQYLNLRDGGSHGHISHLNLSYMKEIHIPLPLKAEQEKISKILLEVQKKISIMEELKKKLSVLKKGLMSDLLSGKVRTR